MLCALLDCPTLSTVLPQNLLALLTTLIYSMAVNHNYDPTYIGPHEVLYVGAVLVADTLPYADLLWQDAWEKPRPPSRFEPTWPRLAGN